MGKALEEEVVCVPVPSHKPHAVEGHEEQRGDREGKEGHEGDVPHADKRPRVERRQVQAEDEGVECGSRPKDGPEALERRHLHSGFMWSERDVQLKISFVERKDRQRCKMYLC